MSGFVKEQRGQFYIDRLARFNSLLIDEIILHELQKFLRVSFGLNKGFRILDLGSGTKPYLPVYRDYFEMAVGVDAPSSLHGNADTDVLAIAESLPFPDEVYDCVICTEVLEHLANPLQALRECYRVLKPGGRLFLSTPFINPLHEIPLDFYRYTPFALKYLAEESRFAVESIIEKGGVGATFLLFIQYVWLQLWAGIPLLARIPLANRFNPMLYLGFVWPQVLYLVSWRKSRDRPHDENLIPTNLRNLSPVTLGYVAILSK